jgi:hypothetical protein
VIRQHREVVIVYLKYRRVNWCASGSLSSITLYLLCRAAVGHPLLLLHGLVVWSGMLPYRNKSNTEDESQCLCGWLNVGLVVPRSMKFRISTILCISSASQ